MAAILFGGGGGGGGGGADELICHPYDIATVLM